VGFVVFLIIVAIVVIVVIKKKKESDYLKKYRDAGDNNVMLATNASAEDVRFQKDWKVIDVNNAEDTEEFGRHSIVTLDDFAGAVNVEYLTLSGCINLTDISGLRNMPNIKVLELGACDNLEDLSAVSTLKDLDRIDIRYTKVRSLEPLRGLPLLRDINMGHCINIQDLSPLRDLASLLHINMLGCDGVKDLTPLSNHPSLLDINLSESRAVSDLTPLLSIPNLRSVAVTDCHNLTQIHVDEFRAAKPDCDVYFKESDYS